MAPRKKRGGKAATRARSAGTKTSKKVAVEEIDPLEEPISTPLESEKPAPRPRGRPRKSKKHEDEEVLESVDPLEIVEDPNINVLSEEVTESEDIIQDVKRSIIGEDVCDGEVVDVHNENVLEPFEGSSEAILEENVQEKIVSEEDIEEEIIDDSNVEYIEFDQVELPEGEIIIEDSLPEPVSEETVEICESMNEDSVDNSQDVAIEIEKTNESSNDSYKTAEIVEEVLCDEVAENAEESDSQGIQIENQIENKIDSVETAKQGAFSNIQFNNVEPAEMEIFNVDDSSSSSEAKILPVTDSVVNLTSDDTSQDASSNVYSPLVEATENIELGTQANINTDQETQVNTIETCNQMADENEHIVEILEEQQQVLVMDEPAKDDIEIPDACEQHSNEESTKVEEDLSQKVKELNVNSTEPGKKVSEETNAMVVDESSNDEIIDEIEQKIEALNAGKPSLNLEPAEEVMKTSQTLPSIKPENEAEDISKSANDLIFAATEMQTEEIFDAVIEQKDSKPSSEEPNLSQTKLPTTPQKPKSKIIPPSPQTQKQTNEEEQKIEDIEKLPKTHERTSTTSKQLSTPTKFEEELLKAQELIELSKQPKPKKKDTPTKAPKTVTKKEKAEKAEKIPKPKKIREKKLSKKKEKQLKTKPKEDKEKDDDSSIRRSSRIKSISVLKKPSVGHGLVKSRSENDLSESNDTSNSPITISSKDDLKPIKVKSRWRRSSELEMNAVHSSESTTSDGPHEEKPKPPKKDEVVEARLKQFVHLKENLYLTDRLACKEAKKMTCDCFLTKDEIHRGEYGCGEDCLNRLLMIECSTYCPVGDRCTNKKFQKGQFAPVEVFNADKKGLGLRAAANVPFGEFILEYVGEVLNSDEFETRAEHYSKDKNQHYYFMSLRADAVIDATMKGNISRFINHSCDPNAETQKWTVNGELRIGFFSTRTILAGEEITFDYRFQRYGKEAQKCYCGAALCRGWLGEEPDDDEDEEEEEDDDAEVADERIDEKEGKTPSQAKVKIPKAPKAEKAKRAPRKKAHKERFEDDQLDEDIEMLLTTGLKNQAHTLKLSRLMVRAKEPAQRAKLLRVLRRGELPCRRLFLDYHGLRLMHGYMTDAQHLALTDKKFESLRLEMLQTLAVLPIPNKTMLQDSKVLPTVEKWSSAVSVNTNVDSDSNSPIEEPSQSPPDVSVKQETEITEPPIKEDTVVKSEEVEHSESEEHIRKSVGMDTSKTQLDDYLNKSGSDLAKVIASCFDDDDDEEESSTSTTPLINDDVIIKEVKSEPVVVTQEEKAVVEVKSNEPNYVEEIIALALKLLEEWSNLKEVFRIPKKERIEQMKEHEREANKGYITGGLGLEQYAEKKNDSRYRGLKRVKAMETSFGKKSNRPDDRNLVNLSNMSKYKRRKLFALQVEQQEEDRRRKQREFWLQHEKNCLLIGADPRFTAPFDPNKDVQCIWNPQIGQWQNIPISTRYTPSQIPGVSSRAQIPPTTAYPYAAIPTLPGTVHLPGIGNVIFQQQEKKIDDASTVKFMGPIPPPAVLPPKWKCAKDKYGRPYYYHVKIRKSQWEPPSLDAPQEEPDESSESSSSESSSESSEASSEDSDSDDDIDDAKLLREVCKQMDSKYKPKAIPVHLADDQADTPSPVNVSTDVDTDAMETSTATMSEESSIDKRLKEVGLLKDDKPPTKKRRVSSLVQEIIISPRTEEDKSQFKEDVKRYRENKEKLKKQRQLILAQSKKHLKTKKEKVKEVEVKLKPKLKHMNTDEARKIKETFRSTMAHTVVSSLNHYRKPDCKQGKITNTEDFKHLARKLTHFVMLKEMKHISAIEELVCSDSVKVKAREYIKKYMNKFGDIYIKRNDEPDDFK